MSFPDLETFPSCHPGPYERQMGKVIVRLLNLFEGKVPDAESHTAALNLASDPAKWTAGHAVFDNVRTRLLKADESQDWLRLAQYQFEEACCQAMYNAAGRSDPFDESSPFWVVPNAVFLAKSAGITLESVADAISADS